MKFMRTARRIEIDLNKIAEFTQGVGASRAVSNFLMYLKDHTYELVNKIVCPW